MNDETGTWKKGISKQGKFPTKAFSGILTAMYPSENAKGTGLLQLDFADEQQVGIYGTDKAKFTDAGVEVGGSLADFQASLEALGCECFWGESEGQIMGFKTEPDIIGMKISIQPLEEQTIGDDTQTKKSVFWGIVTKIEAAPRTATPTAPKTPGRPAKPSKPVPAAAPKNNIDTIVKRILDESVETMGVGELYTHFKKEYKPGELRDAIAIIGN